MIFNSKIGKDNEVNRQKWIEENLFKIPAGARILDAGAGELKYKKYCSHLEYVSQDFCQYEGKGNKKGLQKEKWDTSQIDIVSDIVAIPEKDKSFDAIMCIEVFEHLPEPIKAIKEFSRLLKKGGHLILTAPFCSLTHFAPYHFYTGYNRYFFEHHLKEAGFEIMEILPNGNYFSFLAQEIRRIPYCANHYASKKVSLFTRLIIKTILYILENIEKNDKNSSEFLCFGYHILARKNKD